MPAMMAAWAARVVRRMQLTGNNTGGGNPTMTASATGGAGGAGYTGSDAEMEATLGKQDRHGGGHLAGRRTVTVTAMRPVVRAGQYRAAVGCRRRCRCCDDRQRWMVRRAVF